MPKVPDDAAPVANKLDRMPARIAAVGLLVIAGGFIYLSIDGSGMPSHYYAYHRSPERFTYPTHDVMVWSAAIAVEALVASVFLWRARSVPWTAGILTLVYLPVLAFFAPFAMHAPPYFGAHLVFLFAAVVWFILAGLGAWLVRRVAR